jgi:extradiol dioxygenase family protein
LLFTITGHIITFSVVCFPAPYSIFDRKNIHLFASPNHDPKFGDRPGSTARAEKLRTFLRGDAKMRYLMDHIVLNVEDDDKMIGFYSEVLMFPTERLDEYRSGKVPFPSLRVNENTIIDLFPKKMWENKCRAGEGRENLNHFCIAMSKEDWRELLDRLRANATSIEEGPVARWGAHGEGTSVYFRDPEGNLIEAKYYNERADQEDPVVDS